MLATHCASECHSGTENIGEGVTRTLSCVWVRCVEDDSRMQIAISYVPERSDGHATCLGDRVDMKLHLSQLRERNADVIEQYRSELLQGRQRCTPRLHERGALIWPGR